MAIQSINSARIGNSIKTGIAQLKKHVVPSPWNKKGKGWQERLIKARTAGFYASCDTLELLHLAEGKLPDSLIKDVFENHLLIPFKEKSLKIKSKEDTSKVKAYTQLLKLAKILRLCRYDEIYNKHKIYFKEIYILIINSFIDKKGWGYVTGDSEIELPPTLEVIVSLSVYYQRKPEKKLLEILKRAISYTKGFLNKGTPMQKVLLLSAYTKLSILNPLSIKQVELIVNKLLGKGIQHLTIVEERFPNSHTGDNDFYHFHTLNILLESILLLCIEGKLSFNCVSPFKASLSNIFDHYDKLGYFSSSESGTVYFWDNYHALKVLLAADKLFKSLLEEKNKHFYMIVSQKHFKPINHFVESDLCAIMMPIREEWSTDMFNFYKATLKKSKIRGWRSDMNFSDDEIMQSIWEKIANCKFVIADCTSKNPNVFYELGLAHALGKTVLITTQNSKDIPFDLNRIRYFEYNPLASGLKKLTSEITNFIKTIEP